MKVTAKLLRSRGACKEQVALFAKLFPRGAEPTEALCRAHAAEFTWEWAALNLLSASAWNACDEARASAWNAYDEACASARKACDEVRAAVFARAWAQDHKED